MAGRQQPPERRAGSFDAFDLARRNASVSGKVDAATLPRVAESVAEESGPGEVSYTITGRTDHLGHPVLDIRLDGAVPLVCQRCLTEFSWPVAQSTEVLLARDERELAGLDDEDEREVVLAAGPLDAATLIEDELLLTLPFVPRCERPECGQSTDAARTDNTAAASAFAALANARPGSGSKSDH